MIDVNSSPSGVILRVDAYLPDLYLLITILCIHFSSPSCLFSVLFSIPPSISAISSNFSHISCCLSHLSNPRQTFGRGNWQRLRPKPIARTYSGKTRWLNHSETSFQRFHGRNYDLKNKCKTKVIKDDLITIKMHLIFIFTPGYSVWYVCLSMTVHMCLGILTQYYWGRGSSVT